MSHVCEGLVDAYAEVDSHAPSLQWVDGADGAAQCVLCDAFGLVVRIGLHSIGSRASGNVFLLSAVLFWHGVVLAVVFSMSASRLASEKLGVRYTLLAHEHRGWHNGALLVHGALPLNWWEGAVDLDFWASLTKIVK